MNRCSSLGGFFSRYARSKRSWLTALCVETAEAHHAFPLLVRNAFLCSLNKSNRDGRDFTLRAPLKMGEVSNALFAVCTSDSACRQARCRTTALSYWSDKTMRCTVRSWVERSTSLPPRAVKVKNVEKARWRVSTPLWKKMAIVSDGARPDMCPV